MHTANKSLARARCNFLPRVAPESTELALLRLDNTPDAYVIFQEELSARVPFGTGGGVCAHAEPWDLLRA